MCRTSYKWFTNLVSQIVHKQEKNSWLPLSRRKNLNLLEFVAMSKVWGFISLAFHNIQMHINPSLWMVVIWLQWLKMIRIIFALPSWQSLRN